MTISTSVSPASFICDLNVDLVLGDEVGRRRHPVPNHGNASEAEGEQTVGSEFRQHAHSWTSILDEQGNDFARSDCAALEIECIANAGG